MSEPVSPAPPPALAPLRPDPQLPAETSTSVPPTLESWLAAQVEQPGRTAQFDMDDAPDMAALAECPTLRDAVQWLNEEINPRWRAADEAALRNQRQHRFLARISIVTGTGAIVLAVLQLALQESASIMLAYAQALEGVAVGAALIAVVFGLLAKQDRRWFGQRHLAERLRMIKFLALGRREFWCAEPEAWRAAVRRDLAELATASDFSRVQQWSTGGEIEPARPEPLACASDPALAIATAVYYRSKRVDFQADYFRRRRATFQSKTERWRHLSVPLFFLSVLCVIAHFVLEQWHHRRDAAAGHAHAAASPAMIDAAATVGSVAMPEDENAWIGRVAVWCVAAAAVIPVFGMGMRSWFAAFELPRSTNLFAAKYQALVRASTALQRDRMDPEAVRRHIAADEHFLENEHREWLRLLLDTEWFL